MTEKPWYPVAYMFVVTAVFSGILIGTNKATKERVLQNEQLFRQRAVVTALGLADEETSRAEIRELYLTRVLPVLKDPNGSDREKNVEQYLLRDDADPTAIVGYGVPIIGQGYWDRIAGVVSL